ncbi:MAG TPA: hypothetical protein VFJ67_09695, partial [Thermodesulfobacteriota bacterium]|nr:hypothetical protein [Thermodesulfobacteriota bacterium]
TDIEEKDILYRMDGVIRKKHTSGSGGFAMSRTCAARLSRKESTSQASDDGFMKITMGVNVAACIQRRAGQGAGFRHYPDIQ